MSGPRGFVGRPPPILDLAHIFPPPMASRTAPSRSSARGPSTARQAPTKKQSAAKAARKSGVDVLPGWSELSQLGAPSKANSTSRAKAGTKKAAQSAAQKRYGSRPLDAVPSLRTGLFTLLAFVAMTLFVSHVYATQAVLADLQDARRENERLRLTHQRLQGEFDRMTGPDAILHRAATIGLEEGVAYGQPIQITN